MTESPHTPDRESPERLALSATLHCLTGCSIGEILGMVSGTMLGLGNASTIVLSVVLAFIFGYLLTMLPLVRSGAATYPVVRALILRGRGHAVVHRHHPGRGHPGAPHH